MKISHKLVAAVVLLLGTSLILFLPDTTDVMDAGNSDSIAAAALTEPNYGGTLNIGTVYPTLSALSWDPEDWNWKNNHDAGMFYEQLFAADLDKSVGNGGDFPFFADAYIPSAAIRGELAETWEWEDPLTLAIHLRRGVMFPEKPNVMEARELTADDVVFSFDRQNESPKKIGGYFDHIDSVTARGSHTVEFKFNRYNAEWDYRFGYGYYSAIMPREMGALNAKDWRNSVGSGPFQLVDFLQGTFQSYQRNPNYWDSVTLNNQQYQLPFTDQLIYRTIRDEATRLSALRTGKLDILETVRWITVDHLQETTPELQWSRWLSTEGIFVALRMDEEPFDDIRVRRALNLAINQQEIVDLYYGGHAEVFAFPLHPNFTGYYQTLDEMPETVQELFSFNPEKAKKLLAEAGYPDGFSFKTQFNVADTDHPDLIPLLVSYLEDIGVHMEVEPMEYAAFLSAMTTKTHSSGYLLRSGHVNPTTTLRKNFNTGQVWNPAIYSDAGFDARLATLIETEDESTRQKMVQDLTIEMLNEAPYIWLPTEYRYTAWWPWVKNYNGELRAGAVRPGPIYARIWVDQQLKQELGF